MKYDVFIREKALNEIQDAIEWYENQKEGLGDLFINDLETQFLLISENPKSFKRTYKIFREVRLNRFPYLVVYFMEDSGFRIRVISVFHTSRNPKDKY